MRKYQFITLTVSVSYFSCFTQISAQMATPNLLHHNITGSPRDGYFQSQANEGRAIVLQGTIILPAGVTKHGYVTIVNGQIVSISDNLPVLPNAVFVNTRGIILPGFVDVHNHVPYNVLPRWKPGRLFTNRNQWRTDPEVITKINEPIDHLESSHFCDINYWSELRGLVGGTTSIMVTRPQACINGLVRNLDLNSGFYGTTELDREHIFNVLDLPPASDPSARAEFVGAANFFIANPFYEALFIHLAEGTDAASKEEFTFMQSQSLLNPKGVVIHGIPLSAADFQAMALSGTALVWSPRSNLELYGETANIHAALNAGVEIALAPDWAVTGSSNMLNELKVAIQWNRERLGGRLTDQQLVDMVTSAPAHIAGVDDQVGSISVGLRADIIVINGDQSNPYRAVIDATAADVGLVFIEGVPLYGDRTFMKRFWKQSELEEIKLPEATKTLATPAANGVVANTAQRLQLALQAESTTLAPLTEPDNFVLPAAAVTRVGKLSDITKKKIPTTEAQGLNRSKEATHPGKLTVTILSNPSWNHFTLTTQSSSREMLQLKVWDVLGRMVEARNGIVANTTFHIGNEFLSGIYIVEVIQGSERQILKLIRK